MKKAHFKCCVCRSHPAYHVHHIIQQKDGGPDAEDNAAPLCPNCHETYGENPKKQKFIRRNRDDWYEICRKLYSPDNKLNQEILEHVKELATKKDVDNAVQYICSALNEIRNQPISSEEQLMRIGDATAAFSVATTSASIRPFAASGWDTVGHVCEECGFSSPWNFEGCPQCGHPRKNQEDL